MKMKCTYAPRQLRRSALGIASALAMALTPNQAYSQEGTACVQVGTTWPNYAQYFFSLYSLNVNGTTPLHIQGSYSLTDVVSVGLSANYSAVTLTTSGGSGTISFLSCMGLIDFSYVANDRWNLSSGVGAGKLFAFVDGNPDQHNSPLKIAWQLNALTARYYFVPAFGMFANVGFGYSGILGVGLQVRLGRVR